MGIGERQIGLGEWRTGSQFRIKPFECIQEVLRDIQSVRPYRSLQGAGYLPFQSRMVHGELRASPDLQLQSASLPRDKVKQSGPTFLG
jgi:hypothetical protein